MSDNQGKFTYLQIITGIIKAIALFAMAYAAYLGWQGYEHFEALTTTIQLIPMVLIPIITGLVAGVAFIRRNKNHSIKNNQTMTSTNHSVSQLIEILTPRLGLNDIRSLCIDIGYDYQDLTGGKQTQLQDLVLDLERTQRLSELYDWLQKKRPDIQLSAPHPATTTSSSSLPAQPSSSQQVSSESPPMQTTASQQSSPETQVGTPSINPLTIGGVILVLGILSVLGFVFLLPEGNSPPIITNMTAAQTSIKAGEETKISVTATDSENEPLVYTWSANRGSVPGGNPGHIIVYTAPTQPGTDTITVFVSDGHSTVEKHIQIAIQNQ